MSLQKIGLEAVMPVRKFEEGIARYKKGLRESEQATGKAQVGIGKSLGLIGLGFAALGAVATVIAVKVAKAMFRIAGDVARSAWELAEAAAPLETVRATFDALAASAGTSGDEMLAGLRKGSAGMVPQLELMQRFNEAASLVNIQFAVNLPRVMELIGKQAASIGKDFDAMFSSYIAGVARLSELRLDDLGIQVKVTDAYAEWAKVQGIAVDAMTKAEQQTAVNVAAMAKLEEVTANVPDVVGTATQTLISMNVAMQDIKLTIGEALTPAFKELTGAVSKFLGGVLESVSEGGKLRNLLIDIGAVALLVARKISGWLEAQGPTLLYDALDWGLKLIEQFAAGMVRGLVAVADAAATIAGFLAGLFAPGSPPKILPDIGRWGADTLTEWLKGFTEADFSVLDAIQRPLKQALDIFADLGRLPAEAVGPAFVDLSRMISESLAETGAIGENVLTALREATGEFGEQIAATAKAQLKLRDSIMAVEEAQRILDETRQGEVESAENVRSLTSEYNQLLRAGASPGILKAKLAELNAAEMQREALKDQRTESEKTLATEKKRQQALQKQAGLQRQVLDELLEIARATVPPPVRKGAKVPGVPSIAGLIPEKIEVPKLDFSGMLADIETRAAQMEGKFDKLLAPIEVAFAKIDFSGLMGKITEITDTLTGEGGLSESLTKAADFLATLSGHMEKAEETGKKLSDFIKDFKKGFVPVAIIVGVAATALGVFLGLPALLAAGAVVAIGGIIAAFIMSRKEIGKWLSKAGKDIGDWVSKAGKDIENWASKAGKDIGDWASKAGKYINEYLAACKQWFIDYNAEWKLWLHDAGVAWDEWRTKAGEDIRAWGAGVTTWWNTWRGETGDKIRAFPGKVVEAWDEWRTETGDDIKAWGAEVATWWNTWRTATGDKLKEFGGKIATAWETAVGVFETIKTRFVTAFDEIKGAFGAVGNVFDTVKGQIEGAISKIAEKWEELKKSIPSWMIPGSPPPLQTALEGINAAMQQLATIQMPRLAYSMGTMQGIAGGGGATTNNTVSRDTNVTVDLGGVAIGPQSMDAAVLSQQVAQAVVSRLKMRM